MRLDSRHAQSLKKLQGCPCSCMGVCRSADGDRASCKSASSSAAVHAAGAPAATTACVTNRVAVSDIYLLLRHLPQQCCTLYWWWLVNYRFMYCIVLPVLHAPSDLSCMCCCVGSQSQQMFKICTADPSLSLAGPQLVSCRAPCVVRLGFWLACGADPVVRGWLGTLCHILCFRLGCWLACGADPSGGGLACYPLPYLAASQAVPCQLSIGSISVHGYTLVACTQRFSFPQSAHGVSFCHFC